MYNFLTLHDSEQHRQNNRPYYRGIWEPLAMERNRLIPFQVAGASLTVFHIQNGVETNVSTYFAGRTDIHNDICTYNGQLFSDYLPEGLCHFKINNKYTEDCYLRDISRAKETLGTNYITSWEEVSGTGLVAWETFESDASAITDALQLGLSNSLARTNYTYFAAGTMLVVIINDQQEGVARAVYFIASPGGNIPLSATIDGEKKYYITITRADQYAIAVTNETEPVFFYGSYAIHNVTPHISEAASDDFCKISVSSSVDFGGTYYKGGFVQRLWKNAVVEKGKGAEIEIIGDERFGRLVKEQINTGTRYRVRMKVTESEYSAMVQNLAGEWEVTDRSGKVYNCSNLDISDPEWYNGNGVITLTFTDNIHTFAFNNTDL